MTLSLEHIRASCNVEVGAIDWMGFGKHRIFVVIASHSSVMIVDARTNQVVRALQGLDSRVTCVHCVQQHPHGDSVSLLLAGSSNGCIALCVAADSQCIMWSIDLDSTENAKIVPIQRLQLQCMQISASLSFIPNHPEWYLLVVGGVDSAVRVFLRCPGDEFKQCSVLRGHDNWVRSLAVAHVTSSGGRRDVLIASASQDRTIRLWKICEKVSNVDSSAKSVTGLSEKEKEEQATSFLTSYASQHMFTAAKKQYIATIHAVLLGHEDWVHSAMWIPRYTGAACSECADDLGPSLPWHRHNGTFQDHICLLTASMDHTLMIWGTDKLSGLWMCEETVGATGVNSLGYYTAVATPDASWIIANCYTGGVHAWRRLECSTELPSAPPPLLPRPFVTGHWRSVVSCAWAIDKQCILTASQDQTVRLHARGEGPGGDGGWFEFARPQIHGHDFHAIAAIPRPKLAEQSGQQALLNSAWQYMYASASEEKVIRVLTAPEVFIQSLAHLRQVPWDTLVASVAPGLAGGGVSACIPALGLSNKAVNNPVDAADPETGPGGYTDGPDLAPVSRTTAIEGQPTEDDLCASTLWPETHKLYGHGNDVYTLAACPLGTCLVSACKAQSPSTAEIRVWDCRHPEEDLPCVQQLEGHSLTVTQMCFSDDASHLLSVSRDRSFTVFAREAAYDAAPKFRKVGSCQKAHERIIWSASWAPSGNIFATGSRDKSVKVWAFDTSKPVCPAKPVGAVKGLQAAVTAVSFSPRSTGDGEILAVGFENGDLELFAVLDNDGETLLRRAWQADNECRHAAAVRCLQFNLFPDNSVKLASTGADNTLRIFRMAL